MNNEERDNMLIEIHGTVKVIGSKVEEHHQTLYGNSKPGLKEDMALLNLKWKECPARKAATTEGKRLKVSHVMMVIAIISFITTVIVHLTT